MTPHIIASNLIETIRTGFEQIPDHRASNATIPSGLKRHHTTDRCLDVRVRYVFIEG